MARTDLAGQGLQSDVIRTRSSPIEQISNSGQEQM
jgi:hypothetical protein